MNNKSLKTRARNNLAGNWGLSVGVALLASMLGGIAYSSSFNLNLDAEYLQELPPVVLAILASIVSFSGTLNFVHFILGGTVNLGYTRYLLDQHDGNELACRTLFSQFDRFAQGFLQRFLRNLYVFLWSLLFIIPGIVKTYSYAMTPYIMTDHPEMTAKEAISASKALMDGHKFELFCLHFSFFGWMVLCIFTLGIGNLFLTPYMNAAEATFYRQLTCSASHSYAAQYIEYE